MANNKCPLITHQFAKAIATSAATEIFSYKQHNSKIFIRKIQHALLSYGIVPKYDISCEELIDCLTQEILTDSSHHNNKICTPWTVELLKNRSMDDLYGPTRAKLPVIVKNNDKECKYECSEELICGILIGLVDSEDYNLYLEDTLDKPDINPVELILSDVGYNYILGPTELGFDKIYTAKVLETDIAFNNLELVLGIIIATTWRNIDFHDIVSEIWMGLAPITF